MSRMQQAGTHHQQGLTPREERRIVALLKLWRAGEMSLRDIEKSTNRTYYRIRQIAIQHGLWRDSSEVLS